MLSRPSMSSGDGAGCRDMLGSFLGGPCDPCWQPSSPHACPMVSTGGPGLPAPVVRAPWPLGPSPGTVGSMSASVSEDGAGGVRQVEVVVSVPTVVKALAIFFGVILVYLMRDALLSIALSAVFVLGLDPPVR